VSSFLVRFGDCSGAAEHIITAAVDAPPLLMLELQTQLIQLYKDNVGVEGIEDCLTALVYAFHLFHARRFNDSREPLPVLEIEQRTSNMQDTDSSVGMSEVAIGATTSAPDTGSTESMVASNTLMSTDRNSASSAESMDISNPLQIIEAANVGNEARTTDSMSVDMDRRIVDN
jgi:hypothetical protein